VNGGAGDVPSVEMLTRLHNRRDFLKLLGAAGIGAAAGASVLPGAAEGEVSTSLEPTDFSFTTRERFRPFHLLAENFVQLDDSFNSNTAANYTPLYPGEPTEANGSYRVRDGKMLFFGPDDYYTILKSDTGQVAPFATVIVEVASLPRGTVYAGLYESEANYVHVYYNKDINRVGIEARVNGQLYQLGREEPERSLFETPFRLAFAATENEVTALVGDRSSYIGSWRPIIKRDVFRGTNRQLDLRDQRWLEPSESTPDGVTPTPLKNGFGARSDNGSTIAFDSVRAGYFGEAGVRDPHAVQYADGTPYIKNGKLYFTLTNAGLGFFEKAHWGVWTMDLSDYRKIEQVGNIFWRNATDPADGDPGDPLQVYGHHAGQIVLDEAANRWIVLVSSWGDFGPQGGDRGNFGAETYPDAYPSGDYRPQDPPREPPPAVVYEPPVDILYHELSSTTNILEGVHVLPGARHPVNDIPFQTEGKWDPGLTRIDGRWYFSYVIALDLFSDFQPALARSISEAADHTQLEFVGADWEKRATEGPIIQKLAGQWRLLASCGNDEPEQYQDKYPMYFLRAANPDAVADDREEAEAGTGRMLAFDGYLDAPHPTNIPHPMVVPIYVRSRGRTKYIMITFNGRQYYMGLLGYGTHGDFYVMQAEQTVRGYEFSPR
jgi:hypothetical protein